MEYALTKQFLAQCLAAKTGMEQQAAVDAAVAFLEVSQAMSLITAQRLEVVERDAHALHLAGQGVARVTIAMRLGVDRATVFRAIRDHQKARRAALKVAV